MLFETKRHLSTSLATTVLLALLGWLTAQVTGSGLHVSFTQAAFFAAGIGLVLAALNDSLIFLAHRLLLGRAYMEAILAALTGVFGRLNVGETLAAGLQAGVGEEVFFRGALLPLLARLSPGFGLAATSILFAMAHLGPRPLRRVFVWTILEGMLFGLLALHFQNLLIPMLVHAVHDICGIAGVQALQRRR